MFLRVRPLDTNSASGNIVMIVFGSNMGEIMTAKKILVFSAHADDAEFFAGGTLARFASEGHEIYEIITTDNGRGSFDLDSTTLVTQSRQVEAQKAAEVIGKKSISFLEYSDGFLGDTPLNVLREQFMREIRKIRPDIVMTFDPWAPFESHPDHRHVAMAAVEAVGFGQLPLFHPEHKQAGLEPHLVAERYYFAKNSERCDTILDISDFVDKKIDALCAHDSQIKMMMDEFRLELETTGGYPEILPLLDRDNYRPMLEMMIKIWAGNVGKKGGFQYGEDFRYERADDLFKMKDE